MSKLGRTAKSIFNGIQVWKIAVYLRLSVEDGKDESASVANQRKIITDYIESYFTDDFVIVDFYVDDGLTGTDDTRDSFRRMMEDVEAGRVNCIVCKALSRAFRNYADQGRYLEQIFPRLGIRFIAESNPHVDSYTDPDAIQHGLEIPINGLMNDRYAAKTSKDIRKTFEMKRNRGEFIGAFTPYGYKKNPENNNHLIIDDEAAEIVRYIYKWYIEGMSKIAIAKKLTGDNVLNPARYKKSKGANFKSPSFSDTSLYWTPRAIDTILRNQMYIGDMVQGKCEIVSYKIHERRAIDKEDWVIVKNTHEAIISESDFEKVQSLLKRNTRVGPKNETVHLMAGFVRCADCLKALHRQYGRSATYYRCRVNRAYGQCTKHSIREDKLIDAVFEAVKAQIYTVSDMAEIITRINKEPVKLVESNRIEKSLTNNRQEIKRLTEKSDNLYIDCADGLITREEFRRLKERFTSQIDSIKVAIERLETEQQAVKKGVLTTDPYLDVFIKHQNITELTRAVLTELVDTVYLHEDESLTIVFNFADRHKQIAEYIELNSGADCECANLA